MALTADRNTPARDGNQLSVPVEAATKIYAGSLVAVNAAGNAVPAADAAGLTVLGMAEGQVDNSAGAAGDRRVSVRRRRTFKFANSAANALTAADVGGDALVEADDIVAKVSTNGIVAGKVIEVDATGVWVEIQ
jgi:hypothetical protein